MEVALIAGAIVIVVIVAWLMKRNTESLEVREVRGSRTVVVPRATVVPRAVVVPDAVIASKTLVPRVIQEAREPNGVFVVMKAELIQHLAMLATTLSMSRSALCRELIMRGLEAWAKGVVEEN